MAIYIDSSNLKHIRSVLELGWVRGVTTNPILLNQSDLEARGVLSAIKELTAGPVFYQLVAENFEAMLDEAEEALEILEKRLVVKLPPNDLGFRVCSELSSKIACCPTAIYAPAQALIAREVYAQYIAVYVNRATRLMGDGIQLIRDISEVLKGSRTELLAASLKSPDEAIAALTAGAHHLTLPYETLSQLSFHTLSDAAIREFRETGSGII
ncbi:MAG: transaldolase [Candidatus Marinimicrobia bacterium]|nr:transaldolase [Candidatus Neomarinimicrobiota bacterium]